MKKLVPLLTLIAAPAIAQDGGIYYASEAWPVQASGRVCSMAAPASNTSDPLTISYDAASGEIALAAETGDVSTTLADNSSVDLAIVFLDNGNAKHDDGWGLRRFVYTRDGDKARFTGRFAGERNVRQILTDLANSAHMGLLYEGQVITSTELSQADVSLGKLQECARQVVAAN